MLVYWGEGKTGVPGETPLGAMEKNQQQTQPTYGVDAGIWTRPHCWEACAHTIAPPLLLEMYYVI